ncbi:hypothetical protein PCASD_24652 [Puccinia coronata f. sp. avenae]|uniref:Uncharacterized protein n=1 Tax=Puccinia coronata f. sp. avenae TaxID=200324 RepID=A0A2N5SDX8_9BASI|nr:hypothetical protein PCASD_24652 [Puccinia coronata f. sp. avenae]
MDATQQEMKNSILQLLQPILNGLPATAAIDPTHFEKNCESFTLHLLTHIHQLLEDGHTTETNPRSKKRRRTLSYDPIDSKRAHSEPLFPIYPSHTPLIARSLSLNPPKKTQPTPPTTHPRNLKIGTNESAQNPIQSTPVPNEPSHFVSSLRPVTRFEQDEEEDISEELRTFIQNEIEHGFYDLTTQFDESLTEAKHELALLNRAFLKSRKKREDRSYSDTDSEDLTHTSRPTQMQVGSIGEKLKFQFENHLINCYQHYLKQFVHAIGYAGLGNQPLDLSYHDQPGLQTDIEVKPDDKTIMTGPDPTQLLASTNSEAQKSAEGNIIGNSEIGIQMFEQTLKTNYEAIQQEVEGRLVSTVETMERVVQERLESSNQEAGQRLEKKFRSNNEKERLNLDEKLRLLSQKIERSVEERLRSVNQSAGMNEELRLITEEIERHVEEKLGSNHNQVALDVEQKLKSMVKTVERNLHQKLTSNHEQAERDVEDQLKPFNEEMERMVDEKLQSHRKVLVKQAVEYRKAIRNEIRESKEVILKDLDSLVDQIESLFCEEKEKLVKLQNDTKALHEQLKRLEKAVEKETDPVLRRTSVLVSLGLLDSDDSKSNLEIFLSKLNDYLQINLGQIVMQDPFDNSSTPQLHNPQAEKAFFQKLIIHLFLRINEIHVPQQEDQPLQEDQPSDPLQHINFILGQFFDLNFQRFVWPRFCDLIDHLEQYVGSQML